jgi:hypothetical protein
LHFPVLTAPNVLARIIAGCVELACILIAIARDVRRAGLLTAFVMGRLFLFESRLDVVLFLLALLLFPTLHVVELLTSERVLFFHGMS